MIAIAHRLSTLRSFDRIVVSSAAASSGRLADEPRRGGPYRVLMEGELARLQRAADYTRRFTG